jgi:signal transduction histidine kinase/CheY-like chemotaxis protein
MAKEKGFYEDMGLDVTIKERNPKQNNISQVINGESEYGLADSVILRYRAEGHPVKVLATIFQHNAMVLISKKESGIVSPYEMRGKKISFQKGLDDSIISSLLKFASLDENDFIKMPMDFSHMDFVRGEVDVSEAYISIEPYWMKKKYNIDVNIIDPRNYGIDFYGDLIFTTEDEVKKHPKRVEAFKKATIQGWQYAMDHKDETIQVILDKYNTRNLQYEQLKYEAQVTDTLISAKFIPLGNVKKERFSILADLYKHRGVSKDDLDEAVNSIIYDPSKKSNFLQENIYIIITTLIVALVFIILLIYNNRHLNYLVKARTKELEKSKQIAEEAVSSKSRFLANMSHEIRTPMNAVLGFVEQLAKSEKEPDRVKMFEIVQDSGQTLLGIINDILDFSKIESSKMVLDFKPAQVSSFMDSTLSMFEKSYANKKVTLSCKIDSDMPACILIDDTRLKQILINLLSNALKFTDENGTVTVELNYDKNSDMLSFKVSDTGIGIDAENLDKVFHAFEQEDVSTTRKFGGTGLGLAISHRFALLMGGDIKVESVKGEGSSFTVVIPYKEASLDSVPKDDKSEIQSAETLNGHVLVVEDNKMNQMLISIVLDAFGLTYDIAEDGQIAFDMFQEDNHYDVILMDENMPVMNGIESVKLIRGLEAQQHSQNTPIIAVTANALDGDRERFIKAGMNDYIASLMMKKS